MPPSGVDYASRFLNVYALEYIRRNGKIPKQVQTRYGEVNIETPRDRDGSFDPQTVRKRETILAEGMANQIIN